MGNWIQKLFGKQVAEEPKSSGAESAEPTAPAPDAAAPDTVAKTVRRSGYVFISYKSEEKKTADEIKAYVEKLGYPCWMAPDSLHRRGTQDYGDDIHRAIRECRCLLFVLSPRALGSWWIRKEVQYAMADCRKPVIPFLVAPIPDAKRDEDSLFIDIRLEKQILNEEGARNGTLDLSVLDLYLATAFGEDRPPAASANAAPSAVAPSTPAAPAMAAATREDWERWRSIASFHLERVRELNALDPLRDDPTSLSPEARREELVLSATEAALRLMRILASDNPPSRSGDDFSPDAIRREASRDLARLVYENGDDLGPEVYEFAAPHAAAAKPWAAFVSQARHYSPDGRTELKESNQTKARSFLEVAVRDSDNPYACVRLGECWQWGVGGDVSGSRALHWYLEARRMGCSDSLFRIAQLYLFGVFGLRRDLAKAEDFARQGAAEGVARCHMLLGDMICRQEMPSRGEQEPDYAAAEEEYAKAYSSGYRAALNKIFDLCYVYNWNPKLAGFDDLDRLLQRAARAGFAGAFNAFVDRTFYGVGETNENSNAAIDYALAGVRQNSAYCGKILGELLVQKASDDEAGNLDIDVIEEFASKNPELLTNLWLKKYLSVFHGKEFPPGPNSSFGKESFPISVFWSKLFESGILPSEVADESRFAPFYFLEFLKSFQASPEGELFRVQRLWRAFRLLDDIRCGGEIRMLGLAEVFPPDSLRLEDLDLDETCAVLEYIPKAYPTLKEELDQKIRSMIGFLRRTGGQNGSLTEADIEQEAAECERILRKSAKKPNRIIYVARVLADLERRLSHPYLAASLRLLRNGYLKTSDSFHGAEFGILFLVLNARYRNPAKNGGVLFAVRDALWKVVCQGDLNGVLPFLELCLFGCRIGDSSIPTDLDSIERVEPMLWELVETEKARASDDGTRELCIRVAFAMSVIFLDRKLVTAAGKENWGRSSLYSVPKAMEWLSVVLELGGRKDWEGVCPDLIRFARTRAMELEARGYVVVQETMKKEFLDSLAEKESREEVRGSQQSCIENLATQVENSGLDIMGFKRVAIEGRLIDFVASSDEVAVLFAVLPPETDYTASKKDEGGDPPMKTFDCIGPNNTVSSRLLETLAKSKEALQDLEKEADIKLAILASILTINSMRRSWKARIEEVGVKLVPHEFFLDYLRSVFPENADEDGNEDESSPGDADGD